MTTRVEKGADLISRPLMKSRQEVGGDETEWEYYGELCGIIAAKRFFDFLESTYPKGYYEIRIEPGDKDGCRKAYHRPSKPKENK